MEKKPKKIKKLNDEVLRIIWDDDTVSNIIIRKLRDECPCVHCKGESVIFSHYSPQKDKIKPEGYQIESIEPVGNYAIQVTWKDKHNTGIYSWDLLKELGGFS